MLPRLNPRLEDLESVQASINSAFGGAILWYPVDTYSANVLLLKEGDKENWRFPGGKIDPKDTPHGTRLVDIFEERDMSALLRTARAAAAREIREESGLVYVPEPKDFKFVGWIENPDQTVPETIHLQVFTHAQVRSVELSPEPPATNSDQTIDRRWMRVTRAPGAPLGRIALEPNIQIAGSHFVALLVWARKHLEDPNT